MSNHNYWGKLLIGQPDTSFFVLLGKQTNIEHYSTIFNKAKQVKYKDKCRRQIKVVRDCLSLINLPLHPVLIPVMKSVHINTLHWILWSKQFLITITFSIVGVSKK